MSVRVFPVRLPHLHTVAIVATLKGGPRFESSSECGLTHFMEHMLFRGTRLYPEPRALMAAFEEAGEEPDAHTGDDELVLSVLVAPDRIATGARLLADVLLRPAWRHLERERRIILEERLEFVDEHGVPVDVDDVSRRLVFSGHPLGRSLLGEEADILRVRRSDLERHRRRLVTDSNLVVAIAGPIGPADVRALRAAFATVPTGPAPADHPVVLVGKPRSAFVEVPGAPQCDVRLTFPAPGEDDPRAPALHVLANILDGGPTARLPVRLVDAGYVYEAHAGLVSFSDVSLLEIDVAVSTPRFVETFERTLAILASLRRGIDRSEVERARERLLRRRAFARDDARESAGWHARRALFGHVADRERELEAIERVRLRDVIALARETLKPDKLAAVLVGDLPRADRRASAAILRRWTGAGPPPRPLPLHRPPTDASVLSRGTSLVGPRRAERRGRGGRGHGDDERRARDPGPT